MKIIPKKRRLQRKTNYSKRKKILEARKPRIVIRKSNKYLVVQYVESKIAQDKTKYIASSKDLLKQGWPENKKGSLKSLGAGYLTGLLLSKKISEEDKKNTIVLDTCLIPSTKGSRVYAVLKGLVDGGLNIGHNDKVFPEEERIKSIENFDKIKQGLMK